MIYLLFVEQVYNLCILFNRTTPLNVTKNSIMTKYSSKSVNRNFFDYGKFSKAVHNKYIGETSTKLAKDLGITSMQAANLRNGMPVGKQTIFLAAIKLNISIDEHLIKSDISQ